MIMPSRVRKFALTTHVVTSVGWLGSAVAFLVLAVIGLTSRDIDLVRAFYLTAEPFTYYVIVPLALAALLTGVIQSLGSTWGLLRHYWVLFKLLLTVGAATVLLVSFAQTVGRVATVARDAGEELLTMRSSSYVLHAAGGLAVLLAVTVFAVYKPRGVTPYGFRKQRERAGVDAGQSKASVR
jgi:hypothetical protein